MLAQINIELEANGLSTNMGSLFHGYLMENINSAYADYFHLLGKYKFKEV